MFCVLFFLHFFLLTQAQWSYPDDDDFCTTPNQESGSCVPIYSCRPMLDALKQLNKPISKKVQDFLKQYSCGFDGKIPKVCCPSNPIELPTAPPKPDQSNYPDVSKHKNIDLLPQDCGILEENKIINGQKTGLFEFPWMALLSYKTRSGPDFKCGGTIITNRYILTAAHCLINLRDPLLGVRVGEHNIKTRQDCEKTRFGEVCAPPVQNLVIEKIIVHPEYNRRTFENDIGLLRVTPINLSQENSSPVCLPFGTNRNFDFTNRNVIVTGWGNTERGTPSSELLKVSLPVVPLDECKRIYENKASAQIDQRQMCAGGKNAKDSCAGDSGGPLHSVGKFSGDSRLIQHGIVSFGPNKCGAVPIPGVYTRVAAFMDWILDNIEP